MHWMELFQFFRNVGQTIKDFILYSWGSVGSKKCWQWADK